MLDTARRMLAGERLYADLIDLNPPYIFWLSQPIMLLARTGIDAATAYRLFVLAVLFAMLLVAWPLTRGMPSIRMGYVCAAFLLPVVHFGEREHLMLGLLLPYVAVAIRRAGIQLIHKRVVVIAGLMAGASVAIKPPAILMCLLLIGFQLISERDSRVLRRWEHIALAIVLAMAFVAGHVFAPFYSGAIRAFGPIYLEFSRAGVPDLLFRHPYSLSVIAAIGLALSVGRAPRMPRRLQVLVLAAIGLLAGAVVQGKGFGYHYLPAYAISLMILLELILMAEHTQPSLRILRSGLAWLVLILAVIPSFAFAVDRARGKGLERFPEQRELASALDLRSGATIAVLSPRLADAYPTILDLKLQSVLPVPSLWFAEAVSHEAAREALWNRVLTNLALSRPEWIVVRAPSLAERSSGDIGIDLVERICRHPAGRRALGGYEKVSHVGGFDILRESPGKGTCLR